MDQALIDFANQNGFDKHSVQSLADFIIERTAKYVTAENVHDVVQAYIPEWLRVQNLMATEALTKMHMFAPLMRDMIRADA